MLISTCGQNSIHIGFVTLFSNTVVSTIYPGPRANSRSIKVSRIRGVSLRLRLNIVDIIQSSSVSSENQTILSASTETLSPIGEGVTTSSASVYNQTWLEFDGVDDIVHIDESTNFSNPFSVAFWINSNSNTTASK